MLTGYKSLRVCLVSTGTFERDNLKKNSLEEALEEAGEASWFISSDFRFFLVHLFFMRPVVSYWH